MRRNAAVLAAIAVGGVLGAEARYALSLVVSADASLLWPTLVANGSGCLVVGILMVVLLELTAPHWLVRPFLGIGVLGGYTTFSSYAVEVQVLLEQGRLWPAVGYLAVTPVLAIASCWAGMAVARAVVARQRGRNP